MQILVKSWTHGSRVQERGETEDIKLGVINVQLALKAMKLGQFWRPSG